jgi:phage terminase small subunit
MPRKKGLTKKEMAFCEAYVLEGLSAGAAYKKAYDCADSTASTMGWKVLYREGVKEYIETLQKEAFEKACISAEKVALKLGEIAFSEKEDGVYKTAEKLKALDLLQKQLGVQHQKQDINFENEIVINID